MPWARSSSSENTVLDSTPSFRFCQKASMVLAPGKRPLMPTMAMSERSTDSVVRAVVIERVSLALFAQHAVFPDAASAASAAPAADRRRRTPYAPQDAHRARDRQRTPA